VQKKKFIDLFFKDNSLKKYIDKFTKNQIQILKDPENYTGLCAKKVDIACDKWKKELKL